MGLGRMKLHHAALALVGWYLMLLPTNGPGTIRLGATSWATIQHSFDTAKECEDARAKSVVPPVPIQNGPAPGKQVVEPPRAFYCVATDDPRLK